MFCCGVQHMELSLAKPYRDFDNVELYTHKFTEIFKHSSSKHTLSKLSSLKINPSQGYEFKNGHDKHSQFLFELCDASKELHLTAVHASKHFENLWRILNQSQAHELCVGDKIKVGFTELQVYAVQGPAEQSKEAAELNSHQHCRYCLLSSYTPQDPLLSLCRCSGSVKFLHLSCLRSWLMMKMQEEDRGHIRVFTINKLQCEICKLPWPKQVLIRGKQQGLLNFLTPIEPEGDLFLRQPYVVLETDTLDEDELQITIFIKIYLADKFYFGDSEETSDLAIETIGVSPLHCYLHYQNGRFFITDCGSTTGTLVTLHDEEHFSNKASLYLQYNQFFLRIGLEEPFFSCFAPEQSYLLRYKTVLQETKQ